MNMKTLVLIDGSSLLSSCYYGTLPNEIRFEKDPERQKAFYPKILHDANGRYTNGMYAMLKIIRKIIEKQAPTHIAFAFDKSRDTFRRKLYPEYKAQRKPTPEPLREQFIQMEELLKEIGFQVVISDKLENDLVWDYPLKAIREIILNMIVHRDYRSASESCVKIFDDRIEFFNPGKLMDGMTPDDLNSGNYLSTLRNKAIANHFNMLGEIEKYGSGVTRVIGLFQEAGLPVPRIEEIGCGIRVTVWKAVDRDTEKSLSLPL